jgi:hypothetical protein
VKIAFKVAGGSVTTEPATSIPAMVYRCALETGLYPTEILVHPEILATMHRVSQTRIPPLYSPDGTLRIANLPVSASPALPLACVSIVTDREGILFSLLDGSRLDPLANVKPDGVETVGRIH